MKHKLIKNFLTKEEINILTDYCRIIHRQNKTNFDNQNSNGDSSFYGDPLMESLMLNKRQLVEKHIKLKLLPTYSYFRVYTYQSDLPKHKDRPSCEISVTVHINSDGTPWEIYVGDKKYITKPGDAVLYKGCEIDHWREPFKGDWHAQTFLHYVNLNGPNKNFYMDQRRMWGDVK
jgi:hypothetical protein